VSLSRVLGWHNMVKDISLEKISTVDNLWHCVIKTVHNMQELVCSDSSRVLEARGELAKFWVVVVEMSSTFIGI